MIVFDLNGHGRLSKKAWRRSFRSALVKIDKPLAARSRTALPYTSGPSVYQELSPIAKRLPDVTLSTRISEIVFPDAYQAFVDWCADDTVFASWGGQDIGVLAKNAKHWELPTFM